MNDAAEMGTILPIPPSDPVAEAALGIVDDGRPVLIDFDHTLFASNSTELFLVTTRPKILTSLLLGFFRGAFPWHLYSSRFFRPRDYLIIATVLVLTPWNWFLWRRRAPELFRAHLVRPFADALARLPAERVTIVSFGIAPLIRPMLRGSPWERCRLVSSEIPCPPRNLFCGKAALLRRTAPDIPIERAVFITDSEDDRDLLAAVAVPHLVPRQGERLLADTRLYLPWRYVSLGKFNRTWVVAQTLWIDLPLALLATRALWMGSVLPVVGLLLLFVSLHAVYEIGYFENDFTAAPREAKPALTEASEMFRGFPLERHAWTWSIILGVLGCLAIAAAQGPIQLRIGGLLAAWAGAIAVTRLVYYVYNRTPVTSRAMVYPFLQGAKSYGLLAVIPAFKLGVALLSAQIVSMWINYAVYRLTGEKLVFPRDDARLAGFVVFGAGISVVEPGAVAEAGPFAVAAMLGWVIARVIYFHRVAPWIYRRMRRPGTSPHR